MLSSCFYDVLEKLNPKPLGVYHESRLLTPKLGVSDRVRLHVVFVRTVHSATSAVMAVVGDGRSGDPLHERVDKRDVYEGEVAKVDSVSELVRRVDRVVDGLRSLVDVARGSVGEWNRQISL